MREATREAARRAGTAPAAIPGADTAGTAQAQWLAGSHASGAGARDYRLYVPAGTTSGRPLLVMLHGCKQDPDDFALGTHMNALAGDARGWLVLYPAQSRRANRYGCWNWFRPVDQQRRGGEPEILAGMVEQVIAAHACDRARVFVAGLSAGGAMACVLAHTHPELFAAVGVHSGVPFASAHDAMSAMHAMKHGHRQVGMWPFARHGAAPRTAHGVPMIVFHGDADEIVHPRNGEQLVEQALGEAGTAEVPAAVRGEAGEQPGGHAYTRLVHDTGTPGGALEHWVVHGAGHAWSGGDENGSFTDPYGPNASTAMLRFFDAAGGAPARPARSPTDSYVH